MDVPLVIDAGTASEARPGAPVNQDSLGVFEVQGHSLAAPVSVCVFAVADGVGSTGAPEVASRLAIQTVRDRHRSPGGDASPLRRLLSSVADAHRAVYRRGRELGTTIATTLTAVVIRDAEAWIAHVGDSRAYLVSGGTLCQLTRDHVRHPGGGGERLITRALGAHPQVPQIDSLSRPVSHEDRFLLCTDGIHDFLSDRRIEQILTQSVTASDASRNLLEEARANGSRDDATAVVVFVG